MISKRLRAISILTGLAFTLGACGDVPQKTPQVGPDDQSDPSEDFEEDESDEAVAEGGTSSGGSSPAAGGGTARREPTGYAGAANNDNGTCGGTPTCSFLGAHCVEDAGCTRRGTCNGCPGARMDVECILCCDSCTWSSSCQGSGNPQYCARQIFERDCDDVAGCSWTNW